MLTLAYRRVRATDDALTTKHYNLVFYQLLPKEKKQFYLTYRINVVTDPAVRETLNVRFVQGSSANGGKFGQKQFFIFCTSEATPDMNASPRQNLISVRK